MQQRGSVLLNGGVSYGLASPTKSLNLKKEATNNDITVLRDQVEQQNLKIERLENTI